MAHLIRVALAHFIAAPWLDHLPARGLYCRARWAVVHDRVLNTPELD